MGCQTKLEALSWELIRTEIYAVVYPFGRKVQGSLPAKEEKAIACEQINASADDSLNESLLQKVEKGFKFRFFPMGLL
jgi:hypothetical protein